ncbi:protein eyes shut homolog [Argopecten irradians]|uniref:protein eyes shut homolog n=1 Tax=Argopecten irradians TaxID=31199 RepID=UPI003719CB6F
MATGNVIWGRGVLLILFIVYQGIRSEQNVALFKPSEQSTNQGRPDLVASKVVDDCLDREMDNGCCTFTAGNWPTTAWWRVDMEELMTINRITITYTSTGERRDRLAGYHLYVSNTTSTPQDGTLCYVDTSSTIDEVQLVVTHQCPFVGRYVTVYNYRTEPWRQTWYYEFAILELCEVQVWGCPSGKFAEDCATSCPSVCYGGNCNSPTGACFYCFTGTYGDFCNLTCPGNCKDNVCEKDTGTCADCIPTTYGIRCELDCSTNCLDRLCDKDNGYCYDCIPMKYGPRCEQKCSTNCLNSLCDKDNGDCSACVPGKHGVICELNCPSNCMDGLCGKDTGHCLGCIPGTYGDTCEQQCPLNCKDSVCGKDTGYCIGCISGKHVITCDQECPEDCKDMNAFLLRCNGLTLTIFVSTCLKYGAT